MNNHVPHIPSGNAWQVVAMKRSGSHAIIQWLAATRMGDEVVHANNINAMGDQWECGDVFVYSGPAGTLSVSSRHAETLASASQIIESYEDTPVRDAATLPAGAHRILVLRDPYNHAASRLHRNWSVPTETWLAHARDAAGETHNYGADEVILYNNWLAYQWPSVPRVARGSSFDQTACDGSAHRMDVTGRWRMYAQDERMKELIADPEVRRLACKLFPNSTDLPCHR